MLKKIFLILSPLLFLPACTSAPVKSEASTLSYTYSKLKLLDIDDMTEILQKKLSEYKSTKNEALLDEALTISLSRPNDDNLLEKLLNSIRYSVDTNDQWEETVETVVDRAIVQLKNETTAPEDQMTYLVALTNLLLEFRPEFNKPDVSPVFEKNITTKIADAELIVSDEAKKESSLNSMSSVPSPSEIAQSILDDIAKAAESKSGK